MTFLINSSLIENDEINIRTDSNGNLVIEHKTSGNIFTVDETDSLTGKADDTHGDSSHDSTVPANPLTADLDAGGQAITNAGSVSTGGLVDSADGQAWETLRELGYEPGDEIVLDSAMYLKSSLAVSSTTYANAFTGVTDMPLLKTTAFDGLNFSRFELEFTSTLHVDNSADTIYHRLKMYPSAELTHTGDTAYPAVSTRVEVTPPFNNTNSSGHSRYATEAKVSANTGDVFATKLSLIGVL